jgi:hypothetical protein
MINHRKPGASRSGVPAADSRGENKSNAIHGLEHIRKVKTPPLRLLLLLRTTYSAATGSTQPLKMSAQAGGRKRTRTDLERGGAPTEADGATASAEPSSCRDRLGQNALCYLANPFSELDLYPNLDRAVQAARASSPAILRRRKRRSAPCFRQAVPLQLSPAASEAHCPCVAPA